MVSINKVGYINFNNKNSYYDLDLKILNKLIIPFPERKIEIIDVPGGNGSLYLDLGGYNDITIPISFEAVNIDSVNNNYRYIKSWLDNIKDYKLYIVNTTDCFYKVKSVKIPSNFETIYNLYGKFDVNFICEPLAYLTDGSFEVPIPNILYNPTDYESKPTYIVRGEGLITLVVNSKEISMNISGEVIVDTELELILKNGSIINVSKKGSWEDLCFGPGENNISFKGNNFEVLVIPNWRTI